MNKVGSLSPAVGARFPPSTAWKGVVVGKKTFQNISITLPETNIALENGWLVQMKFPFGARPIFRGYVSFREGMLINLIDTCTKNVLEKNRCLKITNPPVLNQLFAGFMPTNT